MESKTNTDISTGDIINQIGIFLKNLLLKITDTTIFFVCVYLVGWTLNAIYPNVHFDLVSLKEFYLMIIGKDTIIHGVNSFVNSPKGEMPNVDKK